MSQHKTQESTLSYRFDDSVYENAHNFPVLYRSMNQSSRQKHPFWVYEAIYNQGELVQAALDAIPDSAAQIATAFITQGKKRIMFSGMGASYNLAAASAQLFSEVTGISCDFVDSSEVLFLNTPCDYPETWVMGLSASEISRETEELIHLDRIERPSIF